MTTESERVRILRKSLNLTLEEFGRRLGVSKVAISRLENGVNNLTLQMETAICREYNVNELWLKKGEGEMITQTIEESLDALAAKYDLSPEEKQLIVSFASLNSKERKAIISFIDRLVAGARTAQRLDAYVEGIGNSMDN